MFLLHAWGLTDALSWNTPSWSISAEWFAYIMLFPVCTLILSKLCPANCLIIAVVLWLSFIWYTFVFHMGDISLVRTDGVVRIIPEFIAGYALCMWLAGYGGDRFGDVCAFVGIIIICWICYLSPIAVIALLPAIVLLMIGLYWGGRLVDAVFGNYVIVYVGDISYSIYMTHLFVQMATNYVVRHGTISISKAHGISILLCEIGASVLIGGVVYWVIEAPARGMILRRMTSLHISRFGLIQVRGN
jgi:peptidoglycan/LPS O-acetylase OafA/YrhL